MVVVADDDLNEVAAAAQLAAALGGPILLEHPQVAAEIGRLKPHTVHLVGALDLLAPPEAEVLHHGISETVDLAQQVLDVSRRVSLPAVPDESTITETVGAITAGDRVVSPPSISEAADPLIPVPGIVAGLARPVAGNSIWIVDAAEPLTMLVATATGRSVGASVVAFDGSDTLGYPQLGEALAGAETIRLIGPASQVDEWEMAVLTGGQQVPGGGFIVLPREQKRRYVAFYGHPETSALGALGEQGPSETLDRMGPFLDAYSGDGSQTVPVFEMIASVASAAATDDGDYSFEWPTETFDEWVEVARQRDAYIILDLQPGRDDFLTQAMLYEEMLMLPNVGLALDPEWRLRADQVHLKQVGRVEAAEVNMVIHWLADLVRDNGLPQKMMLVHQFQTFMIQDRDTLEERPEIQLIIQMDGDGTEEQKDSTYGRLNEGAEDAFWAWGWKNFFDEDEPGPPSPENTMGKEPSPVYVSYQ